MEKCSKCGKILIKQRIKDGKPLNDVEKQIYERHKYEYSRTLQCESCGNLCYHNEIDPPESGMGLCRNCEGNHSISKPRDFNSNQLDHYLRYSLIWSCPDCGVL